MAQDDDLLTLGSLDPAPVTALEAAAVLGVPADDVFALAESLVEAGRLTESGPGWVTTDEVAIGGPRRAHLAGLLAAEVDDPGRRGRLLVVAERTDEARPLLVGAGLSGDDDAAEAALALGGCTAEETGLLHLALASHHRAIGASTLALDHAERAVTLLTGDDQVSALGFVAQVADDLGRPHAAAAWAALGAGAAVAIGSPARQGTLLTLGARSLSRLGFAAEADQAASTGRALVEAHGSPQQRARARLNQAWVLLDHGSVAEAAETFRRVVDLAGDLGGDAEVAAVLASESRALLRTGRSAEGWDRFEAALARSDTPAPRFLAHLGLAEAAAQIGAPEALEAARTAHALADEHLPAWRSTTSLLVARALRVGGDAEAARAALDEAAALVPDGIDGHRLRLRVEAEGLAQAAGGGRWPREEAALLTDALLEGRWYDTAVEVMTLRAHHERGTDIGLHAAALAVRIGNPVLAAGALEAAGGWQAPEASAVANLVRRTAPEVADRWREAWQASPGIARAADITTATTGDPSARLGASLLRAGLDGDTLSPAQRREADLRFRPRRTARGWLAPIAAVAALLVASAALIIGLLPDPEPVAADPQPTTTTTSQVTSTLPIVECRPEWPGGTHTHRAGPEGTGHQPDLGIGATNGYCWAPTRFSGETRTGAVAWGNAAYVTSSTRDQIVRFDQAGGIINTGWPVDTGGRLLTPPDVGTVGVESGSSGYVVWVTEDGSVRVRTEGGAAAWAPTTQDILPGRSPSGPVVAEGRIHLGRVDGSLGYVAALDLGSGATVWDTREALPDMAPVSAGVSVADGVAFVVDDSGVLWMLDAIDGTPLCDTGVRLPSISGPGRVSVEGDLAVVPGDGSIAFGRPGDCSLAGWTPTLWEPDEGTEVAVADGVVYFVTSGGLMGWSPADTVVGDPQSGVQWPIVNPSRGGLGAGRTDRWSTSPVVAGGLVLMGSREGEVAAINVADGSVVWSWQLDGEGAVVGEVVPLMDGVLAVTEDGTVHLLGGPRR